MGIVKTVYFRTLKPVFAALLASVLFVMPPAFLPAQDVFPSRPINVYNDVGGNLETRITAVHQLRMTRQPIRIVGDVCYSTCTLYLGLRETCISPDTEFGFHGPSSYGKPLDPTVFERASQLIAAHYPEPIRAWYLKTARYEIVGLFKVRGAVLINLGIKACTAA